MQNDDHINDASYYMCGPPAHYNCKYVIPYLSIITTILCGHETSVICYNCKLTQKGSELSIALMLHGNVLTVLKCSNCGHITIV